MIGFRAFVLVLSTVTTAGAANPFANGEIRPLAIDSPLQATYLGGSFFNDEVTAVAINATTGEVYVAGITGSTEFPGTNGGAQSKNNGGGGDAFVARLNANLTVLEQATYLGGKRADAALALAINTTTGQVYVAGSTQSTDFPGTSGGAQSTLGGGLDGFVVRLNANLTVLEQATYLGGISTEEGRTLALGQSGEVYVSGVSGSGDFPGTAGGAQSNHAGSQFTIDCFVARLNANLTAIEQATYLGGSGSDNPFSLAINRTTGEIYVTGTTASSDFPGTNGGAQSMPATSDLSHQFDAFVARLNAELTTLEQATYLGGSLNDQAQAVAINAATSDVYVAGSTPSTDFPGTSGGAQGTAGGGGGDAFVARLNASLTALEQATYLGGSRGENILGLATNAMTGEVYVAGATGSSDFPGTSGGTQSTKAPGFTTDAIVARLDASLTKLHQASYLGGSKDDGALALAISAPTGDVYIAGQTVSTDFPATVGGAQSDNSAATYAGFVARLSGDLAAPAGATATSTATLTPIPIATQTNTPTLVATATLTTPIVTTSPTQTLTSTPTRSPGPTLKPFVGDCNEDTRVTVDEILTMVNLARVKAGTACSAGDANGDQQITSEEILAALTNALNGGKSHVE